PELSADEPEIDCLQVEMPTLLELLSKKQILESEGAAKSLYDFCQTYNVRQVQEKGRKYLSCLLMLLINNELLGKQSNKVFESLLQVIEKVCNRTVYLVLLVENKAVLEQLIKLAIASPWVVSQISRTPILLDELIDPERLYSPPTRENLQFELNQIMERIDVDDEEQRMDALRVFKHVNVLRVAAADLTKAIALMVVSDKLSEIAEVIINKAVALSWHTISQKYGVPKGAVTDQVSDFTVIGFGKLGGIELGFGSDLDLVFLHKEIADDECTQGENSIPLSDFYSRLVRRIILLLTTRTMSGPLYEIDLRLRPNGNSGLLISSISSFEKYQLNQSWTWEQQALIRARPVAGGKEMATRFNQIRCDVLSQNREPDKLRQDIVDMRQKMRDSLFKEKVGYFDLKQGYGGIVDIEFIVQFGVLTHASENQALLVYTDNIRLLQELEKIGYLTPQQCQQLTQAYQRYREASHHAVLAELRPIVEQTVFEETAQSVETIWNQIFNKK
ncbi:MAG: bifunctional [glutamate--ammonia ligase]-adenylyl-L-tyrosine phosphorylase/[glutamate--ammonia-ligase] adenylyltransferase, partial [Gammaproteobacteria bacterium]|nr:bifunctional [glutamate--ammonia ligase]-adenylyl-L-tyrosine phosphorylase/[glutamate--ammonia-ligase] adenylyltransferase [Gammaproteobacteria bacterium]